MILPSNKGRIVVATRPVVFRNGHGGLAALVNKERHKDSFTGTVFVFRLKRADRPKLLHRDGTGLVMAYKRLDVSANCARVSFRPPLGEALTASAMAIGRSSRSAGSMS